MASEVSAVQQDGRNKNNRPEQSARRPNRPHRNRGSRKPDTNVYIKPAVATDPEQPEGAVFKDDTKPDTSSAEGDDESKVCFICAEPVKYYSVSECNHRTCHVCALRLRALYKKYDCTLCKLAKTSAIFTTSQDKPFSEYDLEAMTLRDTKLSIFFEANEMMEESFAYLRYNCPDPDCDFYAITGWSDLKVHVRGVHGKSLCELCIRFKKVFVHEHVLYTRDHLWQHNPSSSNRVLRPYDKNKVEGGVHPMCEFCRECYFGDDELYVHMRERHEECFICKNAGSQHQYFKDYEHLEQHFIQAHHACTQSSCLAKKFVVFISSMDLQAHMVEEHGGAMTTKDRKEARRITAEFEYEDTSGPSGRRRRDRERDREPPPPVRQPTPRAGGRRREGFGTMLTDRPAGPSGGTSSAPAVAPFTSRRPSPSPERESVDPALAAQHAAFLARLNALSNSSPAAVQAVKASVRSYRASECGARDVITTLFSILDRDLEGTASLINGLLDILDDEEKKKSLLSAWNGFKVEQREPFPELMPTAQGSGYAGIASGRVLNIKQTKAPRSTLQSTRVWDRVAQAAASAASPSSSSNEPGPSAPRTFERFPALHRASLSATPPPGHRQPQHSTPWASSASATSAAVAAASIGTRVLSENRTVARKAADSPSLTSSSAFPSLPTSAKMAKPAMGGNQSLRNIVGSSAPSVSAWANGGNASTDTTTTPDTTGAETRSTVAPEPEPTKGKKKKGKEKVTLFTFGTHATA